MTASLTASRPSRDLRRRPAARLARARLSRLAVRRSGRGRGHSAAGCDNGAMTAYPYDAPASAALLDARARGHPGRGQLARCARSAPWAARPASWPARKGPYLTDADGREYVDLVGSWGPMILGHAHPDVAGGRAARRPRTGSATAPPARTRCCSPRRSSRRVEPVEQVRLVSSGTEATMSALRLARGFTGRSKVVKFAGCYHGHVDALLASAGSGLATFALPDSAGVPALERRRDDRPAVQRRRGARGRLRRARRRDRRGHHRGRRRATWASSLRRPASPRPCAGSPAAHGALLICDEVMTGFRCSASGWYGLEGPYDEGAADLFTFGKVMGGGFPAAAFGGRADVMAMLAPFGPVYQAGTLSGNPVATAAGLATLRGCTPEVYDRLGVVSTAIAGARPRRSAAAGVPHVVQWAGSMFSRLLPRGRGPRLRRRESPELAGLHGVLPLDAEPGRAPAAERVRVVVRQRQPRRRRRRPGGQRACPRRPARSQTRLRHSGHDRRSTRRHHGGAPAAPR